MISYYYVYSLTALLRIFTYRVPEGAQGHVRQGWLLDWSPCHVALAEPLVDVEFSWHYSAGVFTYASGYGMGLRGLNHQRVDSILACID